jgi:Holliday junction resolvasome RuvABC endonuclease subunit
MEGKVIGIDPGMTTGWAYTTDSNIVIAGSWDLKRDESHELVALFRNVCELIDKVVPEVVCYEEPVARGMAARSLNRQMGVIILACEVCATPHYPVNPGTLKKHATGMGNATKEDMAEALWGKGGHREGDHNAVDAHWLADYARNVVLPTMGMDDDDS